MLRFGTSGIPRSSARAGTGAGIQPACELGLDCLEMAWVMGVRMGDARAERIAGTARACGIDLTVPAPCFVNLCGSEDISERSAERLTHTGRLAARCGAKSSCFRAGYCPWPGGRPSPQRRVARRLARVAGAPRQGAPGGDVRPELTGRVSQLGTLDEILAWAAEIPAREDDALHLQRTCRRLRWFQEIV